MSDIKNYLLNTDIVQGGIIHPSKKIAMDSLSSVVTTIGTFVISETMGRFARSLSFSTERYVDAWMEEALYGVLSRYNNIKNKSNLYMSSTLNNQGIKYRLGNGEHRLKYRKWIIYVTVSPTASPQVAYRDSRPGQSYNITNFSLDPNFIDDFEKDMRSHYTDFVSAGNKPGTISMFVSENSISGRDFYGWIKTTPLPSRSLKTVYLDIDIKQQIVNTVNSFFLNKKLYEKNGIPYNLKIMLYGEPGLGKDTIARMIASEWNRNIYYIKPTKTGMMIPDAISSNEMHKPLIIVSDIDNYPEIINKVSEEGDKDTESKVVNTSGFAKMLNALDGMMSGEGKIIIMTTNHIDKFHPTFLRPGRVDLMLELRHTSVYTFRCFVKDQYGVILPETIKLNRDNIKISELQMDAIFLKMSLEDLCKKYLKAKSF